MRWVEFVHAVMNWKTFLKIKQKYFLKNILKKLFLKKYFLKILKNYFKNILKLFLNIFN